VLVAFTHELGCDLDDDCWCFSGDSIVPVSTLASFLDANHYLGATGRGLGWSDEYGVLVLALPTSRRLPKDGTWLELSRWCLLGEKNAGSRQWKQVRKWLRVNMPHVTTIVSSRRATGAGLPRGFACARRPRGTARGRTVRFSRSRIVGSTRSLVTVGALNC
jgi:hypothetical protein